jgi:hypothetical protein
LVLAQPSAGGGAEAVDGVVGFTQEHAAGEVAPLAHVEQFERFFIGREAIAGYFMFSKCYKLNVYLYKP